MTDLDRWRQIAESLWAKLGLYEPRENQLQLICQVIAEAVAEEVARSAKSLEFAGYLATAAEHYQSVVSRDADDDTDERADAWRALSHALYEFRKRLARQQPAPDEAPTKEQA